MANEVKETKAAPKGETVKVRVIAGRVLIKREFKKNDAGVVVDSVDSYAKVGDIIDMPREEAESLLKRSFDGYPSRDGTPGKMPGTVGDSPIELVPVAA